MSTTPNKELPGSRGLIASAAPDVLPDPQQEPRAYDEYVRNRGIRFRHQKAALCPNVTNLELEDHNPACPLCRNGYVYYCEYEPVMGMFTQNRLEKIFQATHVWKSGLAVISFQSRRDGPNGEFNEGEANEFEYFDRVTVLDYTRRHNQLVVHSVSGMDRLKHYPCKVDFLRTFEREYFEGKDFKINEKGYIEWLPDGDRPQNGRLEDEGEVYTISYHYNPTYIVLNSLHELRATQANKMAVRLPQSVMVKLEVLDQDKPGEEDDPEVGPTSFPADSANIFPSG